MMTPEAQALVELASKVEAATGADRDLNYELLMALGWSRAEGYAVNPQGQRVMHVPDYTASLDAAMTLVPEQDRWFTRLVTQDRHSHSWRWELRGGYGWDASARAATPALALTAAALRALASLDKLGGVQGEGVSDG